MRKGKTNNPNGRPKGSVNKVNRELKELISKFATENFSVIMKDLEILEPKDRVAAFLNLLKFVVPLAKDKEAQEETTNAVGELIQRLFPHQEDD